MTNRRAPLILVSIVACSLVAAGCGGSGGSAGVATVTSTTTAAQHGLTGFSRCMRSHGVSGFPDPTSGGDIQKRQVVAARASDPSRFDSASKACENLLPDGSLGPPPVRITAADQVDYLKAAACMRTHGFPNFPDPTFANNEARVEVPPSINQDSSRFKSAATTCTKLIPAGLPYSKPSGP